MISLITGISGSRGPVGDDGPTGGLGSRGRQGIDGDTGPTGYRGMSEQSNRAMLYNQWYDICINRIHLRINEIIFSLIEYYL